MGITLKMRGKPFEAHPMRPTVKKLLDFLNKAPVDEIFTLASVAQRSGVAFSTLRSCNSYLAGLAGFTEKVGGVRYYGHPKAIAELRRQVAAE